MCCKSRSLASLIWEARIACAALIGVEPLHEIAMRREHFVAQRSRVEAQNKIGLVEGHAREDLAPRIPLSPPPYSGM